MSHLANILSSVVASTLRGWRGSSASRTVRQPAKLPELFDREDDPECRLVREALTELNLDVMIYPCPEAGDRFSQRLDELSRGSGRVPFLYDPNTEEKMDGAQAIIAYLFRQYCEREMPPALTPNALHLWQARMASAVRPKRLLAQPSKSPAQPLILYSFESSPYSRPVREKLCELQLPYRLVNLGKQQVADIGPAKQRLHLGPYRPVPGTKRAEMLARWGRVQVPFLIDPNESVEMFESKDILDYLDARYAFAGV